MSHYKRLVLTCDHAKCRNILAGTPGQMMDSLRDSAMRVGWRCLTKRSRKKVDYCPAHYDANGESDQARRRPHVRKDK